MNIPKWLLPVIAVVAAGAVAVAAVLIGMNFAPAPPASQFAPPATETAQVLQPLPLADVDPDAAPGTGSGDGDPGTGDGGSSDGGSGDGGSTGGSTPADPAASASPVSGEAEVAVAEEDPATTDRELLRLVDLIGLSPDLLGGLIHMVGTLHDDDPCAPRDGSTPPDDCPPGIPGAVYVDGEIPPLWLTVDAWAQTHAEARSIIGPAFSPMTCDPAAHADGTVDIRIRTTGPGTWTVRYWPDDRPGDALTLPPVSASTAQQNTWDTEHNDLAHGHYVIEHCVRLPDIAPGTPYTVEVTGNDVLDRPASASTHFHSDGRPQHPGLAVQTLGQNLMLVSAPHSADETVTIRPYVVTDGTTDCSAAETTLSALSPVTFADHIPVSAEEQRHLNATPDITQRALQSYRVPEGARILLCGRWFPGSGSATWESGQATFESSLIVMSPDRNLPLIRFVRYDERGDLDDRTVQLDWSITTAEGILCGSGTWSTGDPLPTPLCQTNYLATGGVVGEGVAEGGGAERVADRGFSGDLVLRIDSVLSSGETAETTVEMPAGAGSCVGSCPLPAGDGFGAATIGGTMIVMRTWDTGLTNGQTNWSVGATANRAVDYVQPDIPQIDTRADWTFAAPGFRPTVSGSVTIPVDRPVDWELTAGGDALTCAATPAPLHVTGHATDTIRITVPDFCMGQFYNLRLRVQDADGNSAIWGAFDRSAWWLPGSQIVVPSLHVNMRWRVDAFSTRGSFIHAFALQVQGSDVPIPNLYADASGARCISSDGIIMSQGSQEVSLTAYPSFGLKLAIGPQRSGGASACDAYALEELPTPWEMAVPITDLSNLDGVVLTPPADESYGERVHLWFDAL